MPKIFGVNGVRSALKKLAQKSKHENHVAGVVSYNTNYALVVHENLEAYHPVGQAKYLEQPARQNAVQYGKMASGYVKQGMTVPQAILLVCLQLQRDSQLLVPVDTGALRASAQTEIEYL